MRQPHTQWQLLLAGQDIPPVPEAARSWFATELCGPFGTQEQDGAALDSGG